MAIVGQQLVAPETGWQRIDDNDLNVTYSGSGWRSNSSDSPFGGSKMISSSLDAVITFNFTGTKLRLIGALSTNWSNVLQIEIDDIVETFTQHSSNVIGQVLNYEKLNLSDLEHFVKITNKSNGYMGLDAIDIDDTGTLKPYVPIVVASNALLRVTMLDSSEREYRLPTNEIDGFVNWYTRTIGTGISCYALNDIVDNSKEYLSFEKIISFKVIPFKD